MASITGFRLFPVSVSSYSTWGGTSGYTRRRTSPEFSISRRFEVKTFCEISPTDFLSSPKRRGPCIRSRRIRRRHLLPISCAVVSTGQRGSSLLLSPEVLQYSTNGALEPLDAAGSFVALLVMIFPYGIR